MEKLESRLNECTGEISSEVAAEILEHVQSSQKGGSMEDALIDYIAQKAVRAETERRLLLERMEKFEKNYKNLIRAGYLTIIIVPIILLALMFSLESKLVFLTWWIITIIVAAVYLITVDYIHSKYKRWRSIDDGGWRVLNSEYYEEEEQELSELQENGEWEDESEQNTRNI